MNNFSVLMSVYFKENPNYLCECLESIANQSIAPSEVVIVHDGPLTPELLKTIKQWKSNLNIVEVALKENQGLGKALNLGLKQCSNELIARMDTDDICHPNRFENQIKAINSNNIELIGSWVSEFDSGPNQLTSIREVPCSAEEIKKTARFRNPINHPSVMYKKSIIEAHGGYEDVLYFEDYFLWLKLLHHEVPMSNLPECLVLMRAGSDQLTRRRGLNYIKREYYFLTLSLKRGYLSFPIYLFHIFSRLPIRALPHSFVSIIYKILRRKV